MRKILLQILDLVFPPNEEMLLVRALDEDAVTFLYSEIRIVDAVAVSHFTDARIRALIHEAKFHGNTKAFSLLGFLLRRYLNEKRPYDAIIPVPLSRKRLRDRGFNQVFEILRSAKIAALNNVLVRTKDTIPQTELPRAERLLNVQHAFDVAHSEHIQNKRILLIDDVITTGATLRAAKAALLRHGAASVTCLAFAH